MLSMDIHPDDSISPVKIHRSDRCFVATVSCFCPCLVLGASESLRRKEKSCMSDRVGWKGCQTCLTTFLLCGVCWPLSPLLACYIRVMDRNWRAKYGYSVPRDSFCKMCCDICFWQLTVAHHLESVRKRIPYFDLMQSSVTEAVDSEHSPTWNDSHPAVHVDAVDTAVVILGANNTGKTELLMKLCCTRINNYDTATFSAEEVRVGLRKVPYRWAPSKGGRDMQATEDVMAASAFEEIWDLPYSQLYALQSIAVPVTHVLLVFDSNRVASLQELKDIYKEVCCLSMLNDALYIVVAAKDDFLFTSTTEVGQAESRGGTVDPCEEELNAGARWAHSMGFEFLPVAARYTVGIRDLLKMLNQRGVGCRLQPKRFGIATGTLASNGVGTTEDASKLELAL